MSRESPQHAPPAYGAGVFLATAIPEDERLWVPQAGLVLPAAEVGLGADFVEQFVR